MSARTVNLSNSKNFDMHASTARVYMRWAREQNEPGGLEVHTSLREMRGATDREREERQSKQQKDFRKLLRDLARDQFM